MIQTLLFITCKSLGSRNQYFSFSLWTLLDLAWVCAVWIDVITLATLFFKSFQKPLDWHYQTNLCKHIQFHGFVRWSFNVWQSLLGEPFSYVLSVCYLSWAWYAGVLIVPKILFCTLESWAILKGTLVLTTHKAEFSFLWNCYQNKFSWILCFFVCVHNKDSLMLLSYGDPKLQMNLIPRILVDQIEREAFVRCSQHIVLLPVNPIRYEFITCSLG